MPTLRYCFTWNNYDDGSFVKIRQFIEEKPVRYLCYGKEVGESGTPHLQGYFELSKQCKFGTLKTYLDAHLIPAKGSPEENYNYCSKMGDFYEHGVLSVSTPGKRSDLEVVREAISKGASYDDLLVSHPDQCAMYPKFVRECIHLHENNSNRALLAQQYVDVVWRPWQQSILDLISTTPDKRTVHWYWEASGNVGKSFLTTYLCLQHNACVFEQGKKADYAYIWACHKAPQTLVVFDLQRCVIDENGANVRHLLALAEKMKDGCVVSTKYESRMILRPSPHVLFFSNQPPILGALSADRWNVVQIH